MKRILSLILVLLSVAVLFSCSGPEEDVEKADLSDPNTPITELFDVPYQFDLSPYIEIDREDYVGIEVSKIDVTITEEDVSNAIYKELLEYADYVNVSNRPIKEGDIANLDFLGKIDGVEFDGGAGNGLDFPIGANAYIEGFDAEIIGHNVGEEFTFELTFPEGYLDDLVGKTAVFEVKVNSIKEVVIPELTDSFVKEKFNCNSLEEFVSFVEEKVIVEKNEEADIDRTTEAFTKVIENISIIDYPEEKYEYYLDDFISYYESMARDEYNMSLPDFLVMCGSSDDEFEHYADSSAKSSVANDLVVFAIANNEKLWQDLTKADYDNFIEKNARKEGITVSEYTKKYNSEDLWYSLIFDEALGFIMENSVEVDVSVNEDVAE